ncbi:hypothetical protein C9I57_30865 [Trinickia symbiotica]|uniref:DUF3564 domain-containing protein n=1 Tax=Trinickia symbiotica TaxID=863227 RepID=A0A2T3XKC1_9BURK|nr:DUF3564 family protein [Trinickia symbiotica]PTB16980.1 hypothetical protein C9I57_30865 [Trinickia symbiotica]
MRITVHLHSFDGIDPSAYAILWFDDELLEWSRESHASLTLPSWGRLEGRPAKTRVCPPGGGSPLFELEDLKLRKHGGPFEGETGVARRVAPPSACGRWHIQCIDDQRARAESSICAHGDA